MYNLAMDVSETEPTEQSLSSSPASPPPPPRGKLTLDKAVDMGEYDPEYLSQFPDWHELTRHMQFELIKKALANRRKQLLFQWMEITRANDYRLKPHLAEAASSIDRQLEKLTRDKEHLYAKYTLESE